MFVSDPIRVHIPCTKPLYLSQNHPNMNMIQYGINSNNNSCILSVSHVGMPTKYQDSTNITMYQHNFIKIHNNVL